MSLGFQGSGYPYICAGVHAFKYSCSLGLGLRVWVEGLGYSYI